MSRRSSVSAFTKGVIASFARGREVKTHPDGVLGSAIGDGCRFWASLAGIEHGFGPIVGVGLPRIAKETASLVNAACELPELRGADRFDWDFAPAICLPWDVVDIRKDISVFTELGSGALAIADAVEPAVNVLMQCEQNIAAVAGSESNALDWIRRTMPTGQQRYLLVAGYVATGRLEEAREFAAACLAEIRPPSGPVESDDPFIRFADAALRHSPAPRL